MVCRQGCIKIDFTTDQCMDALQETGTKSLDPLRMVGNIAGQKAQELTKHRVVACGGIGITWTIPSG
jgi:hypothetical protein